ncbi:MAG: carbohydrate-binding domain-containing protein [Bacteroidales bacterium]|nr:carbohydrate-binding domain-containing protein [Bacteroidales bacterium]
MKTRKIKLFTVAVFALTAFSTGCKDLWEKDEGDLLIGSTSSGTEVPTDFNEQSSDYEFDENAARYIHCKETSITLENCDTTVSVSGQFATVKAAGTYFVDGVLNNGQIKVDAEGIVKIVLNGADITCSSSAPIFIKDCEKAVLIINDGTTNQLTDYENSAEENGVIYSKENFSISGADNNTGTLTINAKNKDGIKCKDGLVINSGNITINSVDDGIIGKDFLLVHNGNITVKSAGDAIKSTKDGAGFINIDGGVFTLTCLSSASSSDTAKNDAIKAEADIAISGGVFNITTKRGTVSKQGWGGGFAPGGGGGNPWGGGGMMEATSNKLAAMHGITCGGNMTISGGDFTINAYGKGLNADGNIVFSNATAVIVSERHGIGADGDFTIESGKLDITATWEGIEATNILIAGGETYINAQDDGINASNTNPSLTISDGFLFVKAAGDGLDSNGDIKVSGGVTVVSQTGGGNSPIDCGDRGYTFTVSGGTVLALGSSDMFSESIPSSTSNPMVYSQSLGNSSSSLAVDDIIAIKNPQAYGAAIFISDKLTNGTKYNFVIGGEISGEEYKEGTGIYFPPTSVSNGKSVSVTATTQSSRGGFGW